MAAVYVSLLFFLVPHYLLPTLYRCFKLAGDLRNIALSFLETTDTRAAQDFSTMSDFPSHPWTNKGQIQALSLLSYSRSALQTKGSWITYRKGCWICKDQLKTANGLGRLPKLLCVFTNLKFFFFVCHFFLTLVSFMLIWTHLQQFAYWPIKVCYKKANVL